MIKRNAFLCALILTVLTTAGQGVLTPNLRAFVGHRQQLAIKTRGAETSDTLTARGAFFVTCKADSNPVLVASVLRNIGANVRTIMGRQLLLDCPIDLLDEIAATEGVQLIDVSTKAQLKTDITRRATQAQNVIDGSGTNLPQAYTGKDVVVALIDMGFDFKHPAFKDADGNLRIKSVYYPGISDPMGERPDGLTGSIYTDPAIILDTELLKDTTGSHGTHTSSIAAGSIIPNVRGLSGKPLGGMAPEADILLCNVIEEDSETASQLGQDDVWDSDTYYVSEALTYVSDYAKQQDKPLVVSMSLNSHFGWHNGTSSMARFLGDYCREGNALILCASNEGNSNAYLTDHIAGRDTLHLIDLPDYYTNSLYGAMRTGKRVKMQISVYDWKEKKEVYRIPQTLTAPAMKYEDMELYMDFDLTDEEIDDTYPALKDKNVYFNLKKYFTTGSFYAYLQQGEGVGLDDKPYTYTEMCLACDSLVWNKGDNGKNIYVLMLNITPTVDTDFHGWNNNYANLAKLLPDGSVERGTSDFSIGDWNTSGETVSVGSWVANNIIKYEGEDAFTRESDVIGNYSYFSSYGTDTSGRHYPDVCAPGSWVYAAVNTNDPEVEDYLYTTREGYSWGSMQGTSMSTPAVAGIVALWMQAARDKGITLTNADIKNIIAHTSDNDTFTEASPERFGAGKINAYRGLLYILDLETAIPSLSKNQPRDVTFRIEGEQLYTDGVPECTPISLYNLSGVLVRQASIQSGKVSLAGLSHGVYAVQLDKFGSTLIRL